jgi:Cu-Zn family superoxide dismutase
MKEALCTFYPKDPNNKYSLKGYVIFTQENEKSPTNITFHFENLPPNKVMGIHIHEKGITSMQTCMEAGGHFNPYGKNHGCIFINKNERHAGDLINNIYSTNEGVFDYSYEDNLVSLFSNNSVIGRTIIIHEKEDDLGLGKTEESLKTGSAGARIACSIIKESI